MNPSPVAAVLRRVGRGLLRVVGHSLFWGFLLFLTMQLLEYHGLLGGFEGIVLDWWVGIQASTSKQVPPKKAQILTVDIDDDSFRDCFGRQSPLLPQSIYAVVSELAKGDGTKGKPAKGPVVMGIDILTDAGNDPKKYEKLRALSRPGDHHTKIVWAASPAPDSNVVSPSYWDWLWNDKEDELVVDSFKVLGLDSKDRPSGPEPSPGSILWAPPLFVQDLDLRVRRLPRNVYVSYSQDPEPTLPRRIAETWIKETTHGQVHSDFEEIIVSYNVTFLDKHRPGGRGPADNAERGYKLNQLFTCQGAYPNIKIKPKPDELARYRDLVDPAPYPVVLLGGTFGTFEHGRDIHRASTGNVSGLLINAYALAAEMADSGAWIGLREWDRRIPFFLDVLVTLGIAGAFWPGRGVESALSRGIVVFALVAVFPLTFAWLAFTGRWVLLGLGLFAILGIVWFVWLGNKIQRKIALAAVISAAVGALSFLAFHFGFVWVSCIGIALGFFPHIVIEIFLEPE